MVGLHNDIIFMIPEHNILSLVLLSQLCRDWIVNCWWTVVFKIMIKCCAPPIELLAQIAWVFTYVYGEIMYNTT